MRNPILLASSFFVTLMTVTVAQAGTIYPDVLTPITVTSREPTLIECDDGSILDRTYNQEGPLVFTYSKNPKYAYLQFKALSTKYPDGDENTKYPAQPMTLFVTCANRAFSMKLIPSVKAESQTIHLKLSPENNIDQNVALFKNMTLERAVIQLIDKVQDESADKPIPYSFKVTKLHDHWHAFKNGLSLKQIKTVKANGVGLILHEYAVHSTMARQLYEQEFANIQTGKNTIGIRLKNQTISRDGYTQVYIVEWVRR